MESITSYLITPTVTEPGVVRVWEETVLLPTYEAGKEEKNPIFLEKRVYQGSTGSVYPYSVIESISDVKKDKAYQACFLENQYIKIMILPQLGGRVHMAYDKVKKRHFIYYNQVVKPALVGLTGPWISGGIEFNWPQHHRPSTFLPTEVRIEEHEDGSKTVWCNEVERMFRTKGKQGFTLYPDKAYLEVNVQVYNRTSLPQTFLWWANPAVVVNDSYKSVFPPDVHAVFDHGKRDVSSFPIATGVYYKQDYSAGVDISRYKNLPVPTSYMAVKSKYNFVGGYQNDEQAGVLHVANHHISPGKKQWTWGNSGFGTAWDRNLTDEDGPYIELMTGVYTDNQPDFTWLQPYEEKSWKQYFMPYSEAGYVKNASTEAIVNIEVQNGIAKVVVYGTGEYKDLELVLQSTGGKEISRTILDLSPATPYKADLPVGHFTQEEVKLILSTTDGRQILEYTPEKEEIHPTPKPAQAAQKPGEISSMEQLFLTGQHLEQYRHATFNPMNYYTEALRREPGDIRCNNAAGLLLMRKGRFDLAEAYFRKAVETSTERNPNPYDGEPYYNLGWSLFMQDKWDDAYEALYKATWNAAWQDPAYFSLAQIDCRKAVESGKNADSWAHALDEVERSLIRNWHNHKARQLKTSLLRKTGKTKAALAWVEQSLEIDSFNVGCLFEKYLLTKDQTVLQDMKNVLQGNPHTYLEYALDFAAAGLYEEASQLLLTSINNEDEVYPMIYYALGYFSSKKGDENVAMQYYRKAATRNPERCFPNRIEEVNILQDAIRANPEDSRAPYYLGNFWYAMRQYDNARACWERSFSLNAKFPTLLRNLALAYYNKFDLKPEARQLLEIAYSLDVHDSRILMELDQLYKRTGVTPEERLNLLEQRLICVEQRDDLAIERIALLNLLGRHEEALELISKRHFHPWEGGEGKITGQYLTSHIELAKQALAANEPQTALTHLQAANEYPLNLGEGKLSTAEQNDVDYYLGLTYRALGQEDQALALLETATTGSSEPQQAFYYNDQQPDKIFYQGLAWRALGNEDKARSRFNKLISHGEKHLFDECSIDYFAVSLPDLAIWEDDLNKRNRIHCNYVMGLGHMGLGNKEKAELYLKKALDLEPSHQGLVTHLKMLENELIS